VEDTQKGGKKRPEEERERPSLSMRTLTFSGRLLLLMLAHNLCKSCILAVRVQHCLDLFFLFFEPRLHT
jgi:hypothetical protein